MNEPESLQQVDRTYVRYRGGKFSYFAGCDYFRLSTHPKITNAVAEGLRKYGLNVAASRVTTGNHKLYAELEASLANFFFAPAALLVSNGYSTNAVVAQALRGEFTHLLIDAKAHVSLRDAAPLFACPILDFQNRDVADLRRVIAKIGRSAKPVLLTDGVYTYESQIAPLADYLRALGPRGMILVDDAHGAGVLGKTGRGALEAGGVKRDRIIQTMTLSKAFGVYGGAILCSKELRERMIARSSMFAGSTPLPLPLAFAGLAAIKLLTQDKSLHRRLAKNNEYIKSALKRPLTSVPVLAVNPPDANAAEKVRRRLLARKIFPSFIKYPGGPPGGYLRLVISSEHTREQLDALIDSLSD